MSELDRAASSPYTFRPCLCVRGSEILQKFSFLAAFLCFQRLLAAVKFSTCAKLYVCVIKSHFLKDMETPFEARAGVVWGDEFYIHSPMLGIFLLP